MPLIASKYGPVTLYLDGWSASQGTEPPSNFSPSFPRCAFQYLGKGQPAGVHTSQTSDAIGDAISAQQPQYDLGDGPR
jgi:hypothetical protein